MFKMCNNCKNSNNAYNNDLNQPSGKRFINDDVKLVYGDKTAFKISKEDLWKKICDKFYDVEDDECDYTDFNTLGDEDIITVLSTVLLENIDIDGEDFITPDNISEVRLSTLKNGLTCLEFLSASDEALSEVYAIIYFDGEDLQCYVPRYGNCIDLDNMSWFGFDDDYEKDYPIATAYCARYGYSDPHDVRHVYSAVIDDIIARFIVK